nr:SDR family oxidoreductase [uncultured Arsenicibacter sp.]
MDVTLITGASNGIGEAFARRLAREKHNLLLVARSETKLNALCNQLEAEHHIKAQYIAVDLTQPDADRLVADVASARGLTVTWLINNAGIGSGGDFPEYSLDDYQRMMRLNMDAMVALTYRFLPPMRAAKKGTIINVGSMAGFNPIPYMNVYAATKGFVKYFTEALWEENRPYHVQTMLLCPGATETGFFEAAGIGADRKSSFSTKNMETPEQVVESAMKGLKQQRVTTISGLQNRFAGSLFPLIPARMRLTLWGNMMRKNLGLHVA